MAGRAGVGAGPAARPLLDELRRKAASEAEARRMRAEAEAARIRDEARAAVAARLAEARRVREREAAEAMAVAVADARRRAMELLLPARAAALDRLFALAERRMALLVDHPGFPDALTAQLRDALAYLPDEKVRVRCAPALVAAVRRALETAGRPEVDVRADATVPPGAVVESEDGVVTVDATFARRLVRDRAALAAAIAADLAGAAP